MWFIYTTTTTNIIINNIVIIINSSSIVIPYKCEFDACVLWITASAPVQTPFNQSTHSIRWTAMADPAALLGGVAPPRAPVKMSSCGDCVVMMLKLLSDFHKQVGSVGFRLFAANARGSSPSVLSAS